MTDKEKILAEIERLKAPFKKDVADGCYPTYYCAMQDIEDFIISLPEEPVSEDLEEAAEEWDESLYRSDAFKAGAKWQKEKDESITKDLGEYINELSKQFPEVSFAKLSRIAVRVAKWQKEQMMKDVVDGEIFCAVAYPHQPKAVSKPISGGYKFGDKVKLLIIKED